MFDAYHKWLGILPKDQPPNHYRLLSLEAFESDLDVIEGAADRQMGFVRQYQSGEHAAEAARLLNDLASARLCLLKPASKASYDAKLRRELTAREPNFPEPSFPIEEPAPERRSQKRTKKTAKSSNRDTRMLMIGGGLGIVVIVGLAIFSFSGRSKPAGDRLAAVSPSKSGNAPANLGSSETVEPQVLASVDWSDSKLVTDPAGQPVDLLKAIDLKRDVIQGDCQQSGTSLVVGRESRVYLPAKLPDDYQLSFVVRREDGQDSLVFGFMMAGRQGMVTLDGWNSAASGLYVDGRDARDNCTTRREKLFTDQSAAKIIMTVHPGHLQMTFEGRTIIDWHGSPDRLFFDVMPSRESAFIAAIAAKYIFESATLIPIKPEPDVLQPAQLDREFDLMSLVDLDRDVQRGAWTINKSTLFSPEGMGKVYLPSVVPKQYTLSATVELPAELQGPYSLGIGLVAGQNCFQFHVMNGDTGLDVLDGRRMFENDTRLAGPWLKPGIPSRIDCTVTASGVRVEVDGKTLVDWTGDFSRLSMAGDWAATDNRRFFLGATRRLKFRDIKIKPATTPPQLPSISKGKPFNLLTIIDPLRDALAGKWERDGASLRCVGDQQNNKLVVPFEVPEEYKLTLRVTRVEGGKLNNENLTLVLPVGRTKVDLTLDAVRSTVSGLHIDHADTNQNGTSYRSGPVLRQGIPSEIVVMVRKTGVSVTVDENTIIDWMGNTQRLSGHFYRATPGRRLALGSWEQGFRFEKLELEALPPANVPKVLPLGSDGKLLPIIDVARDSRKGEWKRDGGDLIARLFPESRLRIPVTLPERYVFSGKVERKLGGVDLFVGLVVGGHACSLAIDGYNGTMAGIDLVDGKPFWDHLNLATRSYAGPLFPQFQNVPFRCFVLPDTVVMECGGKEVIRWHGDPRRLSARHQFFPPNYSKDDRDQLWIGGFHSEFAFRDLELKPLSDVEAEQISKSFAGVFPVVSQLKQPLKSLSASSSPIPVQPADSTEDADADLPVAIGRPTIWPIAATDSRAANSAEWINLLEWAAGVDWSKNGIDWNENLEGKPTKDGIRLKRMPFARFPLPAIIDGNYEMDIEFTREHGTEGISVQFPVGTEMARVNLSGRKGTVSFVDSVDGKKFGEHRPGTVSNNVKHRLLIKVHVDGDTAGFNIDWDNVPDYFRWEGTHSALAQVGGIRWHVGMLRHAVVGSFANSIVFHKVRIRMQSGTISKDFITDADRASDLKNGFVRLIGEKASSVSVGWEKLLVNQWSHEMAKSWPLVTREFKPCSDYYGAHAPSSLKCPIPAGAKSFSVVGFNQVSRTTNYQIYVDGKKLHESAVTAIALIKVDIPAKASLLELDVDAAGDMGWDQSFWCYPRFHTVTGEQVTDKMLDAEAGSLKFRVGSSYCGVGTLVRNQPFDGQPAVPIHFRDVQPCDEFLFAHAPSTLTYQVPDGMTRFTAIGYNTRSQDTKFEVWVNDTTRIYESPRAGIAAIDLKLPPNTKTLKLKINDLGNNNHDHSFWCYPRLYRK